MIDRFKKTVAGLMAFLVFVAVFADVSFAQVFPFLLFLAFYFLKEYREKEWASIAMGVVSAGMFFLNWYYKSFIDVIIWVLAFVISLV